MATFERQTLCAYTPCRPGSLDHVAAAMAQVQAELLLIHPFREGNGRIARWVTDLMAMQAGLPAVDYAFTGKGSPAARRRYLQSVLDGYRRDYEPLTRFLRDGLDRALTRPFSRSPTAPSKQLESNTLRRSMARRARRSRR